MRKTLSLVVAGFGAGLLLAGTAVEAHHAFAAEFDANRPVRLQGKITRMEWINPHAWMHLDVEADDGTVESWMIEAGGRESRSFPVPRSWLRDIRRSTGRFERTAETSRFQMVAGCSPGPRVQGHRWMAVTRPNVDSDRSATGDIAS